METKTQTLTEFLLARIAEDEALAQGKVIDWAPRRLVVAPHPTQRPRLLAEVEAKRRIVAAAYDGLRGFSEEVLAASLDRNALNLRILATVYADHPDYRNEWSLDAA